MIVGIPKEVKTDEYRVAITPAGVRELTSAGHTVYIEHGAGEGRRRPGVQGEGAGTRGVPPARGPLGSDAFHLPAPGGLEAMHRRADRRRQRGHRLRDGASGRQLVAPPRPDERGGRTHGSPDGVPSLDAAGRWAGRAGVLAARVVILGAGVVGMAAATMAVGMHSDVFVLDRNLDRLRQFDHHFRGALETVASSQHAIEEICVEADIVIGAVLVVGARAPMLVSDDLVGRMRHGSVLVDISVDQGGCFESTRPTTHTDPTYEVRGSIFYCVANMPGAVPHTSTHALANATLPYMLQIADHGWKAAVRSDHALAEGVNVADGQVVYQPVAEAHGLAYTPLEQLIA